MESRKNCPYCGEEILAVAIKCKHCGSNLHSTIVQTSPIQKEADYAWVILGIPVAAVVVLWTWVANLALIQGPGSALAMTATLCVISTAAACAFEASKLGMRADRQQGTYSPSQWAISILVLWIVSYPFYLFKRRKFGVANLILPGLLVVTLFLGSVLILASAIESKEAEIRESLNRLGAASTPIASDAQSPPLFPDTSDLARTPSTRTQPRPSTTVEQSEGGSDGATSGHTEPGASEAIETSTFDTQSYCRQMGESVGGSSTLELSCRQQEEAARASILRMGAPDKTGKYCHEMARSIGGSYVLMKSCIEQELQAAKSLQ